MVSIIVPIYNTELYLRKCLESIQNQTFRDLEVILINDGSNDGSLAICQEFVAKDNRFKLFNQENKGLSETRNIGLKYSSNAYLTFVDSDDWLEPDAIQILFENIKKTNSDIACCGYFIAKPGKLSPVWNDNSIEVWTQKTALSKLLSNREMKDFSWAKLFKKELWEGVVFPRGKYFEDIFTIYKLFEKAHRVVKINQSKYYYREHNQSITSSNTRLLKKELDLFESTYNLYLFANKNPEKIENPQQVKADITKLIYRIKKQSIHRFDLQTDDFKFLSKKINPVLRQLLKENSVYLLGLHRFVGALMSLYFPSVFKINFLSRK